MQAALGDRARIGAGTVLTPEEVRAVAATGASFIVSPNADPRVIARTKELGLGSYPGVFTPTECFAALAAGADALKIFPAAMMGTRRPEGDPRRAAGRDAASTPSAASAPPTSPTGAPPAPTASASARRCSSPAGPSPASPSRPAPASPPGTPRTACHRLGGLMADHGVRRCPTPGPILLGRSESTYADQARLHHRLARPRRSGDGGRSAERPSPDEALVAASAAVMSRQFPRSLTDLLDRLRLFAAYPHGAEAPGSPPRYEPAWPPRRLVGDEGGVDAGGRRPIRGIGQPIRAFSRASCRLRRARREQRGIAGVRWASARLVATIEQPAACRASRARRCHGRGALDRITDWQPADQRFVAGGRAVRPRRGSRRRRHRRIDGRRT